MAEEHATLSNLNPFFAVHRETESQVPSDADLEQPDGKNAETGKFQVSDFFLRPGVMLIQCSQIRLGKRCRVDRGGLFE